MLLNTFKKMFADDCFENGCDVTFKNDLSNKRMGIETGYIDHPVYGKIYFVINLRCMITLTTEDGRNTTYGDYDTFLLDFFNMSR